MGEWVDWLSTYGQIERLSRAYAGEQANDMPSHPSRALLGYLRCVRQEPDLTSAAVAVSQIRDLLNWDWEVPEAIEIMERLSLPRSTGGRSQRQWLDLVATLIEEAIEYSILPSEVLPETPYEWRTLYRDLHGLVSITYHQDALLLNPSLDGALGDSVESMSDLQLARIIGEIRELKALKPEEGVLAQGMRFLGSSHSPPEGMSYSQWLDRIADACQQELDCRRKG